MVLIPVSPGIQAIAGLLKVAQTAGALNGGIPHVRLLTATDDSSIVLMNGGSGIKKSRVLTEEINQKLKTFDVSSEGTWLKKAVGTEL